MRRCSDCGVALVDENVNETRQAVVYDLAGWDDKRVDLLLYQLNERRIWWSRDGETVRVRAGDVARVDEVRRGIEASYDAWPDEPDAFILPDGRRVKELPVGPDVPANTPIEWSYNSWTLRWFLTLFREVIRRMTGRP
jgi:hypothetical protein